MITPEVAHLPERIERACCWWKNDWPTDLYLDVTATVDHLGDVHKHYEYKRVSNGDVYFSSMTVDGLVELLDDQTYHYKEVTP